MRVRDAAAVFVECLRGQSVANRYNYGRRLALFVEWYGGRRLRSLRPVDVNRWHGVLVERGYEEATMAGYRQSLKALFNFCVREGWLSKSPADHLRIGSFVPRQSRRLKLPPEWAVEEAAAVAWRWLDSDDGRELRNGLLFLLCLLSGPRAGELRALRRSEVEAALLHGADEHGLFRATSRGKTKEVAVRWNGLVAVGLRRWLMLRPCGARVDRCFVTLRPTCTKLDREARYRALSAGALIRALQHVAGAAGLERPILSHALRHRLGDRLTRLHGPKVAAMALNHRDWRTAATAIAFYHHPDEADVSRALAALAGPADVEQWAEFFGVARGGGL